MKVKTYKINISAEFTTIEELRKILNEVIGDYELGYNARKKTFSKWILHDKNSHRITDLTVKDLTGKKYRKEFINGELHLLIESKMNEY